MVWEFDDNEVWVSDLGLKRIDGTYNSEFFGQSSGHYLVRILLKFSFWLKWYSTKRSFDCILFSGHVI